MMELRYVIVQGSSDRALQYRIKNPDLFKATFASPQPLWTDWKTVPTVLVDSIEDIDV